MSPQRPTTRRPPAAAPGIDAAVAAAWEAALDTYASVLDEHRTMLLAVEADVAADHDAAVPPPFVPPLDLRPMPTEMLPWARQLLEQTNGLMQLARQLADRSERALSNRPRLIGADSAASTLDALL